MDEIPSSSVLLIMAKKKLHEIFFESYSKIIETIFMIVFLYGIGIGSWAVFQEPTMLDSLLVYIGGSTTIATSFYFWKAKNENMIKLKKENPTIEFPEFKTEINEGTEG